MDKAIDRSTGARKTALNSGSLAALHDGGQGGVQPRSIDPCVWKSSLHTSPDSRADAGGGRTDGIMLRDRSKVTEFVMVGRVADRSRRLLRFHDDAWA